MLLFLRSSRYTARMSIYALKSRFQSLLRPLVIRLATIGVTANQVTLLACFVSIGLGVFLTHKLDLLEEEWLLVLPAWMFLRMALNAIDGMLAREHNQKTTLGGYLNELTDIISDAALYFPFIHVTGVEGWLVLIIIWLSALVETAGILGQATGGQRHYHGPMGKSDRAFVFGALALWVGLWGAPLWVNHLLGLVIALLVFSLLRRVRAGL